MASRRGMSLNEGKLAFRTQDDHGMISSSSKNAARIDHGSPPSNRPSDFPQGHAVGHDRTFAGIFQPARRAGAPDLETHRAGHDRHRPDIDADHDLRGLPATRRDLRPRRRWYR